MFKRKDGTLTECKKITYCPKFEAADEEGKKEIIKEVSSKSKLFLKCFYIEHKRLDCKMSYILSVDLPAVDKNTIQILQFPVIYFLLCQNEEYCYMYVT